LNNYQFQKLINEIGTNLRKERIKVLAQSHSDAMEVLRESIRENVKDGWALLPFFTPAEYCYASSFTLDEKDKYFIELIDQFEIESIFEDFKKFFGHGWGETFKECIFHINNGSFRAIIPFLISALEKAINSVINKEENFFGKKLTREYQIFVKQMGEHIYIKELAVESKKVFKEYIFKNGVKEHGELPIFNRNLIQHGNDTPDRWGKEELYKIISLIGGIIHIANIIGLSNTFD
jgi:hypothetical protein